MTMAKQTQSRSGTSIQAGPSNLANLFAGPIDEVEIFNRALSASEIQAIDNAGSAGKCKPDADGDGVIDFLRCLP